MNAPASPLDCIELPAVELPCRIGVAPGEADRPQTLRLRLWVYADLARAAASGDLHDTIDYCELLDRVEELAASQTWTLLETLAGRMLDLVGALPRVQGTTVRLEKVRPPWSDRRGPAAVCMQRGRRDGR
jgi:7,8-dihydroneopterin aldolase/epimerase/oxygenase